jgi:hypothetical protein
MCTAAMAQWGAVAYNESTGEVHTAHGAWIETTLHITALETWGAAEALLAFSAKLDKTGSRFPVTLDMFVDSQAACAAITHGQSPSMAMDTAARFVRNVAGRLNRAPKLFYIISELNPSDEPSRCANIWR